jgi:hypothetical protein
VRAPLTLAVALFVGAFSVGAFSVGGAAAGAPAARAPADRLPTPRAEPCLHFTADPAEGEYAAPAGLDYDAVTKALSGVLPTALYCPRPAGATALRLTFELVVGCDGRVSTVSCSRTDRAPPDYVACVEAVLKKADFPAHDLPDGMEITYPVNVAW